MEHRTELPYDDRNPSDGELFSVYTLYAWQPHEIRMEHARHMRDIMIAEDRVLYRLSRIPNPTEADLELARQAEDHFIRALGAYGISIGGMLSIPNFPVNPPRHIEW